jgi:protein-tyrosine phosphatase
MLLAFRRSRVVPGSEKLEKWLLDHGIRPLIAHPERNRQIMRDALLLETFLDLGCRLQVTAGQSSETYARCSCDNSGEATAEPGKPHSTERIIRTSCI